MERVFKPSFVRYGDRPYVQGAAITYALCEAVASWELGEIERLRVTAKNMLFSSAHFVLLGDASFDGQKLSAECFVKTKAGSFNIGLVPDGDSLSSVPYDEEALILGYQINQEMRAISLIVYDEAHLFNKLIALQKKMLNKISPADGGEKWIFVRFDLRCDKFTFSEKAVLSLKILAMVGDKNCKSNIFLNEEFVGLIYFSRNTT